MYTHLKYKTRYLLSAIEPRSLNASDPSMNLFFDWNADDQVSPFEMDRNNAIQDAQGNRNPFIDNQSIATEIWDAPIAKDPWGGLNIDGYRANDLQLPCPMPVARAILYISGINTTEVNAIDFYTISGQLIRYLELNQLDKNGGISLGHFENGNRVLTMKLGEVAIRKKILFQ